MKKVLKPILEILTAGNSGTFIPYFENKRYLTGFLVLLSIATVTAFTWSSIFSTVKEGVTNSRTGGLECPANMLNDGTYKSRVCSCFKNFKEDYSYTCTSFVEEAANFNFLGPRTYSERQSVLALAHVSILNGEFYSNDCELYNSSIVRYCVETQ